ncbi:hypothetical protein [Acaryochloris marina]|uniref:hypothetical protein n=1 Tax=Acaryochloris marina TaxID=155978 RepID=UPI001BB0CEF4|nr:hypothetical protein [Acaryochloris marina]QUY40420.1 hypothetical protein I1H34_00710 [Acaryochloris marina S15]
MFDFENLDSVTRASMLQAIEEADRTNNIYYSNRFNQAGKDQWLSLLKQAAEKHNEHWLAYQLEANALMKEFEGAHKPSGGYTIKHVPDTAAETMAEGQFNRFYILGLCKRARDEGISQLVIYRAKERSEPRPESQKLLGNRVSIEEVEAQLKRTKASFGSPLVKPNSGLSVKLG